MAIGSSANAQDGDLMFEVGVGGGIALGLNESEDDQIQPYLRAFLGSSWIKKFQTDLGIGYALNSDDDYETELVPIDVRMRYAPFSTEHWFPYVYAGIGALYYNVKTVPQNTTQTADLDGWTAHLPYGIGLQYRVSDYIAIDLSAGNNFTFSDEINPVISEDNDNFLSALLSLRYTIGAGSADSDNDGLANKLEKQMGTDRKNPDTDGDGLSDGDEVNTYLTSPLNSDSDGDGLNDGDEVKIYGTVPHKADSDGDKLDDGSEVNIHGTNPTKADSDGDGLDDSEEVKTYMTDPLKADSDGDGLGDQEEVLIHMTDPKMMDTDADGLTDAQEVTEYKTDPKNADTDGGTISDADEIARGTDPLNAEDDVPKLKVEKGERIVLEDVVFNSGSVEILPESEETLIRAFNTLQLNPEIEVIIEGYTDNTGSRAFNMKLSSKRANAVKQWLIDKGINSERMAAKGLGPDSPVAPNDTKEGRQKNRRIEFVRVK